MYRTGGEHGNFLNIQYSQYQLSENNDLKKKYHLKKRFFTEKFIVSI